MPFKRSCNFEHEYASFGLPQAIIGSSAEPAETEFFTSLPRNGSLWNSQNFDRFGDLRLDDSFSVNITRQI
ncbi:hypothetical protein CO660_12220 [Rhizobium sp. L9]|nr:hypothetical protein CO660_12220 [Rhizobium sp. L9]